MATEKQLSQTDYFRCLETRSTGERPAHFLREKNSWACSLSLQQIDCSWWSLIVVKYIDLWCIGGYSACFIAFQNILSLIYSPLCIRLYMVKAAQLHWASGGARWLSSPPLLPACVSWYSQLGQASGQLQCETNLWEQVWMHAVLLASHHILLDVEIFMGKTALWVERKR